MRWKCSGGREEGLEVLSLRVVKVKVRVIAAHMPAVKVLMWDRVGIQWRADDNYALKFCAAVVDLLLNFDNFL